MVIIINKEQQLKEIQTKFHKQFPFLKIEFYSQPHRKGEGSVKKNTLDTNLTFAEVSRHDKKGGVIQINKSMKVSELEKAFADIFGLSVQVFRKSNNMWLQTTITDNWSLEKQNKNATEMYALENLPLEPDDYHEQL